MAFNIIKTPAQSVLNAHALLSARPPLDAANRHHGPTTKGLAYSPHFPHLNMENENEHADPNTR